MRNQISGSRASVITAFLAIKAKTPESAEGKQMSGAAQGGKSEFISLCCAMHNLATNSYRVSLFHNLEYFQTMIIFQKGFKIIHLFLRIKIYPN